MSGAITSALVSLGTGYMSYKGAKEQADAIEAANRGAGDVDIYNKPWEPSVPHRQNIMNAAWQLWQNEGRRRAGGGGRGGGGGQAEDAGWSPSGRSTSLADALAARARGGHPLYGASTDYTGSTLAGAPTNPFMGEAATAFGQLGTNPDMNRFIDELFAGQMPGAGQGVGDAGARFRSRTPSPGGGGGMSFDAPVGAAGYIKDVLDEKYLAQGNPYRAELIDAITGDIQEKYTDRTIPGINAAFAGAGRFGSEAWKDAMAKSAGQYADSLSDAVTRVRSQDYNARMQDLMNAMNMGAGMDMNAADNAARLAAARSSAGASRHSSNMRFQQALEELASRERLARMGALGDMIGVSTNLDQARAGGLSGLAELFSADQRHTLGMVPELSGLDIRDLGAALQGSTRLDELDLTAREQDLRNQARNRAIGARNRRFNAMLPWQKLGSAADIINAMSGSYGRQHGFDRRRQSPQFGAPSPIAQGIAGGIGGWEAGQDIAGALQDWWQNRQSNQDLYGSSSYEGAPLDLTGG